MVDADTVWIHSGRMVLPAQCVIRYIELRERRRGWFPGPNRRTTTELAGACRVNGGPPDCREASGVRIKERLSERTNDEEIQPGCYGCQVMQLDERADCQLPVVNSTGLRGDSRRGTTV